jgi:hypothetical protein
MNDRLSRAEIRKDAVQETFTAATHTVGTVATIITTAVGDIGRAIGGFATEVFEIRESSRRADRDQYDEPDLTVVTDDESAAGEDQPNDI